MVAQKSHETPCQHLITSRRDIELARLPFLLMMSCLASVVTLRQLPTFSLGASRDQGTSTRQLMDSACFRHGCSGAAGKSARQCQFTVDIDDAASTLRNKPSACHRRATVRSDGSTSCSLYQLLAQYQRPRLQVSFFQLRLLSAGSLSCYRNLAAICFANVQGSRMLLKFVKDIPSFTAVWTGGPT